jgi:uncharacterized membrane protein YidH (DUF202 family)
LGLFMERSATAAPATVPSVNVPTLLLSLILNAAGVTLFVLGRRQRLNRAARGQEPGANVAAVVGVSLMAVGLLNLGKAFI